MNIVLGETQVTLLADRGAYLPATRTLVIADVHLGKSATFRTRGIPVPEGDTEDDLLKISRLIKEYQPSQLVIAGDLVHSYDGMTLHITDRLIKWLERSEIEVVLTEGNHDRRSILHNLPLTLVKSYEVDGIKIVHDPSELSSGRAGIAGHLHPSFCLRVTKREKLYFKGYYIKQNHHLVLPAFSEFTGTHPVVTQEGDRFISITENHLHELPIENRAR